MKKLMELYNANTKRKEIKVGDTVFATREAIVSRGVPNEPLVVNSINTLFDQTGPGVPLYEVVTRSGKRYGMLPEELLPQAVASQEDQLRVPAIVEVLF